MNENEIRGEAAVSELQQIIMSLTRRCAFLNMELAVSQAKVRELSQPTEKPETD